VSTQPKSILELGCGSGQIYKHITWPISSYHAIDFSSSMCELHPKNKHIKVECFDFDSNAFHDAMKNKHFDMVISSSALQWSKDLERIVKTFSDITKEVHACLFTSNTFKRIQELSCTPSPILNEQSIKRAFSSYFECEFETYVYNLEFDDKKSLFDYIKKSGVSGANRLSFKEAKMLYKNYDLNYLEFEVIFVKAKRV
jgi:malonyl-CoA O-methyltransferase